MGRHLKSLKGLEAFEAAARHLSFASAAEELGVTPAAISQRVRALEQTIGVKLFNRCARAIKLTPRGEVALELITSGFDQLEQGFSRLVEPDASQSIVVSTTPSFASRWLIPRLCRFSAGHPNISVRLDTSSSLVNFQADVVDIAIRQGRGIYPGTSSEMLLRDYACVVCHPELQSRLGRSSRSNWQGRLPLLHVDWEMQVDAAPTWERWSAHNNITDLDLIYGTRFSMEDHAVRAALAGLGYALVTRVFVETNVRQAQLIEATTVDMRMPTAFHHYVVHQLSSKQLREPVARFRNWLFDEAARD